MSYKVLFNIYIYSRSEGAELEISEIAGFISFLGFFKGARA